MCRIFRIDVEPVGKGRPKFVRSTGRAYTPKKTVEYERSIREHYDELAAEYGWETIEDVPVDVTILCFMPIPKSTSKKKRQQMIDKKIRPVVRPDVDNMAKSILDALQGDGGLISDDSHVVDLRCSKFYAEEPHVIVSVSYEGRNE